jgi:hypothetical protein
VASKTEAKELGELRAANAALETQLAEAEDEGARQAFLVGERQTAGTAALVRSLLALLLTHTTHTVRRKPKALAPLSRPLKSSWPPRKSS